LDFFEFQPPVVAAAVIHTCALDTSDQHWGGMPTTMLEKRPDSTLLAEYVNRSSADAFAALVDRHTPMVYSVCLRVLGDKEAAHDAVQATFLVLVQRAHSLSKDTTLPAWLYSVAVRIARNAVRSRGRYQRHTAAAIKNSSKTVSDRDPIKEASLNELKHKIDGAMATLPADQRNALVLRFMCGLTEADCARELNCPLNTIHSRVTSGLAKLRQKLGHEHASTSPALLAAFMSTNMMELAPQGLSGSVTSACLGKTAASSAAAALAKSLHPMAGGATKTLIAGALLALLAGVAAITVQQQRTSVAPTLLATPSAGTEAVGNEYHVAVDATPGGDGSAARPWDLGSALASEALQPGDSLFLHSGNYTGAFTASISGSSNKPIVVRPIKGERVVLTGGGQSPALTISGAYLHFHELEISNTFDRNPADDKQPNGAAGVNILGRGVKVFDLVVHDAASGITAWRDALDAEIRGCIIYNNGYETSKGRYGSGIVIQNSDGTKKVCDCIIFSNYSYGISAYGSTRSAVRHLLIENNIVFGGGSVASEPSADIHIGGDTPVEDVSLTRNYTWQPALTNKAVRLSSIWAAANKDITLQENYFIGTMSCERDFDHLTSRGNTVIADRPVTLFVENTDRYAGYDMRDNHYYMPRGATGFSTVVGGKTTGGTFDWWRETAKVDADSLFETGLPNAIASFVLPASHDGSRAHIVVYNWSNAAEVDVASRIKMLRPGDRFELRRVQDLVGRPVLEGMFDGKKLSIPMDRKETAQPTGGLRQTRETTPQFDVFVLIKK
jgi:RNA polymerase sigma factor (sigma-70 family)